MGLADDGAPQSGRWRVHQGAGEPHRDGATAQQAGGDAGGLEHGIADAVERDHAAAAGQRGRGVLREERPDHRRAHRTGRLAAGTGAQPCADRPPAGLVPGIGHGWTPGSAASTVARFPFRLEFPMVLTKSELIESLQNEVRILSHLAGKVAPEMRDYRPTPKQRSALELLQYLSIMGPELVKAGKSGGFNPQAWTAAETAAKARDWDQTLTAIAKMSDEYASLLAQWSDSDFRADIDPFGRGKTSKGAFLSNMVLAGHA